jgi:hypothetical protein
MKAKLAALLAAAALPAAAQVINPGMPDAPSDGLTYGRRSGVWHSIAAAASGTDTVARIAVGALSGTQSTHRIRLDALTFTQATHRARLDALTSTQGTVKATANAAALTNANQQTSINLLLATATNWVVPICVQNPTNSGSAEYWGSLPRNGTLRRVRARVDIGTAVVNVLRKFWTNAVNNVTVVNASITADTDGTEDTSWTSAWVSNGWWIGVECTNRSSASLINVLTVELQGTYP